MNYLILVYAILHTFYKVEDMEKKVAAAEEKSAVINTIVQTKIVEKIKVVREITNANVQVVEKIVTKYDNICTLSNAAIVLHNSASQNVLAPSSGTTVEGTSDVKASELVKAVAENYGLYYQVREQVLGWQMWYSEQKKVFENIELPERFSIYTRRIFKKYVLGDL